MITNEREKLKKVFIQLEISSLFNTEELNIKTTQILMVHTDGV